MSLLDLPNELLHSITHYLDKERDINALIQTSRFFRDSFNEYLYEYNIKKNRGSAILWAAEHGSLELTQRLLDGGANPDYRTNPDYGLDAAKQPIALAAANGHEEVVELLLNHGAGADGVAPLRNEMFTGHTALHFAALGGHDGIARHLISGGAQINGTMYEQYDMPIHAAAQNNHLSMVRLLVNHGAALDQRVEYSPTPLYLAADEGHESIVRFLLVRGALPNGLSDSWSPLHAAATHGNAAIARFLLDFGADTHSEESCERYTPLGVAAELGLMAIIELLLGYGHPGDNKRGSAQALSLAVLNGHEDAARRLLENGVDPNWGDYNSEQEESEYGWHTVLMSAAACQLEAMCKLLLEHGADPNTEYRLYPEAEQDQENEEFGVTALQQAVRKGNAVIVEAMLAHKGKVDRSDSIGNTLLHEAVESGNVEVVKVLLRNGGNPNRRDWSGFSSLHLAAQQGRTEIVHELLETFASPRHGVEYNQRGIREGMDIKLQRELDLIRAAHEGCTAMHYAAKYGHKRVVQLLLDKGAEWDRTTKYAGTVLHVAACNAQKATVQLLLENGADPKPEFEESVSFMADFRVARCRNEDVAELLIERCQFKAAMLNQGPLNASERYGEILNPLCRCPPTEDDADRIVGEEFEWTMLPLMRKRSMDQRSPGDSPDDLDGM